MKRIVALKKPTSTLRPPTGRSVLWRLLSHLSLNYLSLVEEGKEALQEILKLYNFTDSAYSEKQIEGIVSIRSSKAFRPRRVRIRDHVRARYTRRDGTRRRAVCRRVGSTCSRASLSGSSDYTFR